jgi:23S rRNA U2552 (ribose-2'-O)-methylase RlmE/FtsJ
MGDYKTMINFASPLCELAYKYGTDKCPHIGPIGHSYTPFYYNLFKDKQESFKKVLELGIGSPGRMHKVKHYKTGASLYMWRDFFPNAQIYGVDILPETMFEDDRIKTFLCDETKPEELKTLIENIGSDIDLVIDDAIHQRRYQINACLWLMPLLNKDVVYIIEDVRYPDKIMQALQKDYNCHLRNGVNPRSDNLIIVRHKNNG